MKAIHAVQVALGGLILIAAAMAKSPDPRLAQLGEAAVPALTGILTLFGLVSHSALPGAPPPMGGAT